MARNKYPEETINKILDVSLRLFMEKGYEQTSIQDIINNLGGLTKGAIYHHFKSKEDILIGVMERSFVAQDEHWEKILHDSTMTGIQKLRALFDSSLDVPGQTEIFTSAPSMLNNPKLLVMQMKDIIGDSVPKYVQPIIEQGIADGSINTSYPKELGEAILLLVNLWLTPLVFYSDMETTRRRYGLFQELMQNVCPDIFDDHLMDKMEKYFLMYQEKRTT